MNRIRQFHFLSAVSSGIADSQPQREFAARYPWVAPQSLLSIKARAVKMSSKRKEVGGFQPLIIMFFRAIEQLTLPLQLMMLRAVVPSGE
jgi:hypothetical protein